ncbi:MAG: ADP-glyceromanno-heptose 6-epimerase [Bacteroidota bacterium]
MIVITGAAGFIGSALVAHLNELGHTDLLLVDDFQNYPQKAANIRGKSYLEKVERDDFLQELLYETGEKLNPVARSASAESEKSQSEGKSHPAAQSARSRVRIGIFGENSDLRKSKMIIHLGARTDTTEKDEAIFKRLNLDYSQAVWTYCAQQHIPLIYASSAATYGGGEYGYDDDHSQTDKLAPLNPYGQSKQDFDLWALKENQTPTRWYGLKFFNVYGPNEYHKGRMASVVWHAYRQIQETGGMKLFRSHRPDIADGQQSRDFIYVKDLCRVISWLAFEGQDAPNGLYNLGTGQARPFIDLVRAVFSALGRTPNISFIDTPADIRDTYQYFTEANMRKLRTAGYPHTFSSLESGIEEYISEYLQPGRYW